ncbi:thioesterase domain-containing protein [Rhizobium sp. FKL33]|uniref:thioesterase domain-containing protein n=1 Tax=Rhizobium sp. FKL33 TaxID=2562307 RepID=UPI001980F60E|nr:thioesterase domain-containing protein [Rhizobium sp. FKL33]
MQTGDGAGTERRSGDASPGERLDAAPDDQVVARLLDIAEKALKTRLDPQQDLLDVGLGVNRALRIIREFWRATGIELDVNIFYRCRNVAEIADAIRTERAYSDEKRVLLREGDHERPLFCYAGGANCFLEMRELISALPFNGAIHGLAVKAHPFQPHALPTVESEVQDALCAIRRVQKRGPYRLMGYSFGGVIALELARALEAEGEKIEFLAMLDSPLSDHCISTAQWLRLMARVVCRQALAFLALRRRLDRYAVNGKPGCGAGYPKRKGHRLLLRFLSPEKADYPLFNPQWVHGFPPAYTGMGEQIMRMKGLYQPRRYEGKTHFVTSSAGSPIDCPSRDVWAPHLANVEWIETNGTHLSMLVGRNAKALAATIGERLQNSSKSG